MKHSDYTILLQVLAVEQKKEEEREKVKKLAPQKPHHGQRIEIWVSPDGTSSEGKTEDKDEDDLDKLEAVEVRIYIVVVHTRCLIGKKMFYLYFTIEINLEIYLHVFDVCHFFPAE